MKRPELHDEIKRDLAYAIHFARIIDRCISWFVYAALAASIAMLIHECRKSGML